MLETQQINQAIADALTALGLAEELAWEDDELMCSEGHFTSMTQWHRRVGEPCPKGLGECGKPLMRMPHDFTDLRYLIPAVESYCEEYDYGLTCVPYDGGLMWLVVINTLNDVLKYYGDAATLVEALRDAFAAALGVTI